jgi:organic radical activating enzyme
MTPWQEFYLSIKDSSWPDCDHEQDFLSLPQWIQDECQQVHGYVIGSYRNQPRYQHKTFPIKTATACQLKWNWSTVYLTTENTASCHRTNHHKFDIDVFDFHNTPSKLDDRSRMLQGFWPEKGCGYCRDIETAGGQSDRITNLDMPGMFAPPELDDDLVAIQVTPRILEVYFDNVCNLKCVYCGPHFSSLWDAENKKHGKFEKNGLIISNTFKKSPDIAKNKTKMFEWISQHGHSLTNFNFLGGEPLFQKDLDDCLDFFDHNPMPELEFQIFTNLNATPARVSAVVSKIKNLIDKQHLKTFVVTASLDCWGPEQEYARFPLKLDIWEKNFRYLLDQSWIRLIVGSTLTPLTIKTLPDLIERINQWRKIRHVSHYMNSAESPLHMHVDILGDVFVDDFNRAIQIMPENDAEQINIKKYLQGIAQESASKGFDTEEIIKLREFLTELDRRRATNWQRVFPWLEPIFQQVDQ